MPYRLGRRGCLLDVFPPRVEGPAVAAGEKLLGAVEQPVELGANPHPVAWLGYRAKLPIKPHQLESEVVIVRHRGTAKSTSIRDLTIIQRLSFLTRGSCL
jgi:hypothetical protein